MYLRAERAARLGRYIGSNVDRSALVLQNACDPEFSRHLVCVVVQCENEAGAAGVSTSLFDNAGSGTYQQGFPVGTTDLIAPSPSG